MNPQYYTYNAAINAINAHFTPLKIAIVATVTGWPLIYSFAGGWGVAGMGFLVLGGIGTAYRKSCVTAEKIENGDRALLWEYTPEEERPGLKLAFQQPNKKKAIPALLPPASMKIKLLDIPQLLEAATGIMLMGNSGSGKTTLAKAIAGECQDHQIVVFDPHDTEWGEVTVIRDRALILEQLQLLLDLLDRGDRTPLVIICDEWPSVRLYAKKQGLDVADEFLLRYGSEGRKYNKLAIFCSQSGNVKALGLESLGDFLENFTLLRLGGIARKYAKNLRDQSIFEALKSIAYPVLMGDFELYLHPNLGHYSEVKDNQKPTGLKPLYSLPLTIPLTSSTSSGDTTPNPYRTSGSTGLTSSEPVLNQFPEPDNLNQNQREELQRLIDSGLSQNQIIKQFFGVSKGGSDRYRKAVEVVKSLQNNDTEYSIPSGLI